MTWDALRGRSLPVEEVVLPLEPVAHAAAVRAVLEAQAAGDGARVESARAALDALPVLAFECATLPPADWENLIDQHPPTDEQAARGWAWDPKALRLPALAAAVTLKGHGQQSAERWGELYDAGSLSAGELDELFGTVVALNSRAQRVSLGKG